MSSKANLFLQHSTDSSFHVLGGNPMPRKTKPSSETEKEIFPTRLRELMEQSGIKQKKLADAIGMRPQTVSLYTLGQSSPDVNTLTKICDVFNVNADYLLGRTDVRTRDIDVQTVSNYTGLSNRAIFWLHSLPDEPTDIFNLLLDNGLFTGVLHTLAKLKKIAADVNMGDSVTLPLSDRVGETFEMNREFYINTLRYVVDDSFRKSVDEILNGGPSHAVN